jgi:RND family efflux transporter MFP subunit
MKWIVIVALLGCNPKDRETGTSTTAPAPFARTERKAAAVEQTGYIGVLTPRESVDVTSPFTSKVTKFSVKLGDTVTKNQALAVLDDRPLREELVIARAGLKEASIAAGAAGARLATERRAFRAGISSKAVVDAAAFEAGQAGATTEQHRAKIAQIEQRLKDTRLTTTIGGRIALRYVEEGARVAEGQPVLRVISSDELFVKFAIPGEDSRKLKAGDPIDVKIDGKTLAATVKSISPELDPIAQMILAEAELASSKGTDLQPGVVCRIVMRVK